MTQAGRGFHARDGDRRALALHLPCPASPGEQAMNPIRSILVHLDSGPRCGSRLRLARALGDRLGASVTALYAATPPYVDLSLLFRAGVPNAELLDLDERRRATARKLVADVCAEPGLPIEWCEARESPAQEFMRQAWYADLMVLGQRDGDHRETGVSHDFVQWILIASGKPAVIGPHTPTHAPGFDTVLVAWKESRESARALSAAMPLLGHARSVHMAVDSETTDGHRALLQRLLQRHGVEARFHPLSGSGSQAGEALLSMAAGVGAGLLVMGCYGHSRGHELILGGVTRTVLHSTTLPVMMVH
jgi:nucleotide-binding universal stress UspA family protein